ncbi:MAG: hypothetical protein QNL04_12905 [SAR324 cluster bacterium]|nr:hypothetical protein [SAR324 cluster bacterium]
MQKSLILPNPSDFPALQSKVICFASLGHFFGFKDFVEGSKVKSFGPSKNFTYSGGGLQISVIGGLIGAGLTMLALENAIAAGGTDFTFFGTAGFIGQGDWEAGKLVSPQKSWDETGIAGKVGIATLDAFEPISGVEACSGMVSVPHFYAMTPEKLALYRGLGADLVDMEVALANLFLRSKGFGLKALIQITDGFDGEIWLDKRAETFQQADLEKAFSILK